MCLQKDDVYRMFVYILPYLFGYTSQIKSIDKTCWKELLKLKGCNDASPSSMLSKRLWDPVIDKITNW